MWLLLEGVKLNDKNGSKWKKNSAAHKHVDLLMEGFLDYTTDKLSSITRYNTRKVIVKQSVMEHSGSVTLIAMVFSDYLNKIGIKNNPERVLRMAIMHDADEVVSGDIPYDAKYSQGELSENLRSALHKLTDFNIQNTLAMIGDKVLEGDYKRLIEEERERKTIDAKIVKLADMADAIIYSRQEEKIGNKVLAEVHKKQIVTFHALLDDILNC